MIINNGCIILRSVSHAVMKTCLQHRNRADLAALRSTCCWLAGGKGAVNAAALAREANVEVLGQVTSLGVHLAALPCASLEVSNRCQLYSHHWFVHAKTCQCNQTRLCGIQPGPKRVHTATVKFACSELKC